MTEVNRVVRSVPVVTRMAAMTTAMRPTIRPYSMAVARRLEAQPVEQPAQGVVAALQVADRVSGHDSARRFFRNL